MSISSVVKTYTFTNGTSANATEVNADLDALVTGVNNAIGAINTAAGSKPTLDARMDVSMNADGTMKSSITAGNEWIDPELSPTYVSATQFTVSGDHTDIYMQYRRLKITLAASTIYRDVSSSSYAAGSGLTTVTVATGLTDPLTSVEHSIITPISASDSCISLRGTTGYAAIDSANTASAIVARDASGNFAAGTITASVIGNVTGTASNSSKLDNNTLAQIQNMFYPIGSLYYNADDSTNPGTLLGFGTWAAFGAGRVVVGNGGGFSAGATGGETTHTLTEAEMPAHTHTFGGGTNDFKQSVQVSNGGGPFAPCTGGTSNAGVGGTTGSSTAHNNMQPYIVVYVWRRTA